MIKVEQPIFKQGSVTSANGYEHEYTDRELDQLCRNYSLELHKAPVQIGHVDSTSPAFGWIEKLRYDRDRGVVMATVSYIDEAVEIIRRKLYQFVSATFYPPNSPNHPRSGHGFYLKSLALLGAQPPAIKGLPALDFCDCASSSDDITCDFIRETLPEEIFEIISEVKDDVLLLQQKVKQLELEKEKIKLTHYIDSLFQKGNLTPSLLSPDRLLNMLLYMKGYQEEIQYSESDSLFDQFTTFLNGLQSVSYSELVELKEPLNLSGSEKSLTPHEKAIDLMKKNKNIKYRDALKQVLA